MSSSERRASRGGYGSGWIRPEKRLAIYLRDEFVCAYCDVDLTNAWHARGLDIGSGDMITLDHLRVRSGTVTGRKVSNSPNNLVTACLSCNCSRGDEHWITFARRVGGESAFQWINKIRRRKLNMPLAKSIIRDRQRRDVRDAETRRMS